METKVLVIDEDLELLELVGVIKSTMQINNNFEK